MTDDSPGYSEDGSPFSRSVDRRTFLLRTLGATGALVVSPTLLRGLANPAAATTATSEVIDSAVKSVSSLTTSHAALRWSGPADAVVQLRTLSNGGTWTPWTTVPIWGDASAAGSRPPTSGLVAIPGAQQIEAQALTPGVSGLTIATINAGSGPLIDPSMVHAESADVGALSAPVPQPPIISRAQWGADESIRRSTPPSFAPISKLIVHHTVTQNNDPDPAATVRGIYAYHVQGNGWDDIGYNFLIDASGNIYEGRWARNYNPGEVPTGEDIYGNGVVGAHALGVNTGSCGVALLGTYDTVGPSTATLQALVSLLSWKAYKHNINAFGNTPIFNVARNETETFGNISGHRDSYQTECPGDDTYSQLGSIRMNVSARLAAAGSGTPGYWVATRDGNVLTFGAPAYGSMKGRALSQPIVGLAPTPSGNGYALVATDGGIFSFGDAQFHGSMGGHPLNKPMVGMAFTPSGNGYWTVASDGGIFAYGDAQFYGSMGGKPLNRPIVGMASTPSGNGYWLVASDGGIFAYGDAQFYGSTGNLRLVSPVTGMQPTPTGRGYYLVAQDGGIFAYGDAAFHGSMGGHPLNKPIVSMALTSTGGGYYLVASDGGVFTFGDAAFLGAESDLGASAISVAAWRPH